MRKLILQRSIVMLALVLIALLAGCAKRMYMVTAIDRPSPRAAQRAQQQSDALNELRRGAERVKEIAKTDPRTGAPTSQAQSADVSLRPDAPRGTSGRSSEEQPQASVPLKGSSEPDDRTGAPATATGSAENSGRDGAGVPVTFLVGIVLMCLIGGTIAIRALTRRSVHP